jgi:hypothetical protein
MTTCLVHRELAGFSMEDLAAAQRAAIATSDKLRAEGSAVRYMRSVFVPSTGWCNCLFEASDAETVARVQAEAALPYEEIMEAYDLPPA